MRSARPSSGRPTGIARNVLYGLVASFLLFSLSVAIQKTFFSQAPEADDTLGGPSRAGLLPSTSRAASWRASDEAAASGGEDDGSVDLPASKRRDSVTGRYRGAAPQPTVAASPRTTGDQAASDPSDGAWSNPLAPLGSLFSFGGGGAAAASPPSPGLQTSPAQGAGVAQVKEVFFGTSEGTACQPGKQQFALDDVVNLYVCVIWSGVAGKYAEQLTFTAPDGHVYQTLTVPFVTADSTDAGGTIEMEGRQFEAQPAGWGANGETLVIAQLPVGGTFISQYSLVGLWTVRVALNGRIISQDNFELLSQ